MGTEVKKNKKKGYGNCCVWVLVSVVVALIAMSMTIKTCPKEAIFGAIKKTCQCPQVILFVFASVDFKITEYLD